MASRLERKYARLFEQEADRLWRAVYAFSQDREIAADAVSEAFAQCIQRGDAVRSPARWVWRQHSA
jgi:DNA-directed RNA polymerase specialized sigma24 family protein